MPLKELDATPELRDDPSLKDFNDLPTLAKSYRETKAFVGNSIRPPGPDASPEARKEFYDKLQKHAPDLVPLRDGDVEAEKLVWNKLGRPAKAEDYVAEVPKDVEIDVDGLRSHAVATGLTKGQFTSLVKRTVEAAQKQQLTSQQDREALQKEWGNAYDSKLKAAAAVAQKFGIPDAAVGAIMAGKMSATQLRLWDSIAKGIGAESKDLGPQGGGAGGALTPAEAEAQFKEVQAHPAYFNRNHPEHDTYVQKGVRLMEQLQPRG